MTGEHPQRCETCKHYQTRFEYGNKKICTLIKERAPGSYQIGIPFHIDIVGCASHSAIEPMPAEDCDRCRFVKDCTPLYVPPCYNGAAVEAAKQARAEVLDAFTGFINAYSRCDEDGQDYVSVIALQNHIESLRQQEGKP